MENKKQVGREIRSLSNALRRYVDSSQVKHQIDNITGTNGWIIGFIDNNRDSDVFQRDLEKVFGITRSTASKVLILMEKKGLVKRVGVPQDARLKKLVLTEKSLELAEMMRRDAERTEEQLTRGFTEEELLVFCSFIERMKKNITEN